MNDCVSNRDMHTHDVNSRFAFENDINRPTNRINSYFDEFFFSEQICAS